jgi:hypothetical protein
MENERSQNQNVPPDLALWIADVAQIQTLASKTPISDENAELIRQSAGRLMDILEGRLSPELLERASVVATEMAQALTRAA